MPQEINKKLHYWEIPMLEQPVFDIPKEYNPPLEEFRVMNKKLLSKKQAQEYCDWYNGAMEERIKEFQKILPFKLDYTIKSVLSLNDWLINNSHKDPDREGLLAESFFYLSDSGMYLNSMILRKRPELYLRPNSDDKRLEDFNEVVLSGYQLEIGTGTQNVLKNLERAVNFDVLYSKNIIESELERFWGREHIPLYHYYISTCYLKDWQKESKKYVWSEFVQKEKDILEEFELDHLNWEKTRGW